MCTANLIQDAAAGPQTPLWQQGRFLPSLLLNRLLPLHNFMETGLVKPPINSMLQMPMKTLLSPLPSPPPPPFKKRACSKCDKILPGKFKDPSGHLPLGSVPPASVAYSPTVPLFPQQFFLYIVCQVSSSTGLLTSVYPYALPLNSLIYTSKFI